MGAIVVVLGSLALILSGLCHLLEVLCYNTRFRAEATNLVEAIETRFRRRVPRYATLVSPLIFRLPIVAAMILGSVQCFYQISWLPYRRKHGALLSTELNPDIVGDGVQFGLFFPALLIIIVLVAGHHHTEPSGAKALGIAQCVGLAVLALNTYKAPNLNEAELLVACASIDAMSATVAMSFSARDMLTNRLYTIVGALVQTVSLIAIPVALSRRAIDSSGGFEVFWWGKFDSTCQLPSEFWVFLTARFESAVHTTFISYVAASKLEKSGTEHEKGQSTGEVFEDFEQDIDVEVTALRQAADRRQALTTATLEERPHPAIACEDLELLPATALSNYLTYLLPLIAAFVAIRQLLAQYQPFGFWGEWGQSSALLVCAAGIVPSLRTQTQMLKKSSVRRRWLLAAMTQDVYSAEEPWAADAFKWNESSGAKSKFCNVWLRHPFGRLSMQKGCDFLRTNAVRSRKPQELRLASAESLQRSIELNDFAGILVDIKTGAPSNHFVVDKTSTRNKRKTALSVALEHKQHGLAFALLRQGADVEFPVDASLGHLDTPLMFTIRTRQPRVVKWLLASGAAVHATNARKETPVMIAAQEGQSRIVQKLLVSGLSGAQLNFYGQHPEGDEPRYTALHWAVRYGRSDITKALLEAGAAIDVENNHGHTALHLALNLKVRFEIYNLLLKAGANVHTSKTRRLICCLAPFHYDTAKLLFRIDPTRKEKRKALLTACKNGVEMILRLFLEEGVNPHDMNTGLKCAYTFGNEETVKLLNESGADLADAGINVKNRLLLRVSMNGTVDMAKSLLALGADIHAQSTEKWSTLMRAAWKGRNGMIEFLIHAGAELNSKDAYGRTAIILACRNAQWDSVRLLVKHGASVHTKDQTGKSALHFLFRNVYL